MRGERRRNLRDRKCCTQFHVGLISMAKSNEGQYLKALPFFASATRKLLLYLEDHLGAAIQMDVGVLRGECPRIRA